MPPPVLLRYEGAAKGRLTEGWIAGSTGANAELRGGLVPLRDRARDLVRNDAYASAALDTRVANDCGAGLRPVFRYRSPEGRLDASVSALAMAEWAAWSPNASTDSWLDFYGLQILAVRAMRESGDVLVRRRTRRVDDGIRVPLQLELLEADYLDETQDLTYQGTRQPSRGRRVLGVEFDAIGRRQAYWLFPEHPGDGVQFGLTSLRVDARLVAHLYEPTRPGQVRGVPVLAPIIRELRDLADFRHASRIAQKMHACILGIIDGGEPDYSQSDDTDSVAPAAIDTSTGEAVEDMQPGMWVQASGGKSIKVHQPPAAPPSEYVRDSLRAVFTGAGVSYEEGAGDFNGASFSASRMSRHRGRRLAGIFQRRCLIPMLLDPIAAWWLETAVAAGVLPPGLWETEWIAPPWEEADPGADIEADASAIELGVMSRQEAAIKRGRRLEDVLDAEAEWRRMRAERGLDAEDAAEAPEEAEEAEAPPEEAE